jgi:hypothetical protein
MGGYNSGRWGYHTKKCTVEECRTLDIAEFRGKGFLRPGQVCSGTCRWTNWQGKETSSLGYTTTGYAIRLHYTITWINGKSEQINYEVPVVWTPCNFGGQRPWFVCPGSDCGRRVAKLYSTPSGRYYLCRHCHDLSYRSRQEYDKRAALLSRHPEALLAMLRGKNVPTRNVLLALKAFDHFDRRLGLR